MQNGRFKRHNARSGNYRRFRAIISDNGYGKADRLRVRDTQVLRECISTKPINDGINVYRGTFVYELARNPRVSIDRSNALVTHVTRHRLGAVVMISRTLIELTSAKGDLVNFLAKKKIYDRNRL